MKRALVFQHMDHDDLGRFAGILRDDNFSIDTIMFHHGDAIPNLQAYDLMIVLGGAMDVWEEQAHPWLIAEKAAIREWVGRHAKPYLGLCLGHQLLADAMGGKVGLAEKDELGVYDVKRNANHHRLFADVPENLKVFEWHHCEVQSLPPQAINLASSENSAIQAMAVGDNAIGLQFHVEFDMGSVERWANVPEYIALMEKRLGVGTYPGVKEQARAIMPDYDALARRIWRNLKN